MRIDGLSGSAVPVEEYALDVDGIALTGLTEIAASVTRESDGKYYSWAGGTWTATPSVVSMIEVSPALYPGLYHVPGGLPVLRDVSEFYTITVEQLGSPFNDVSLPRSFTVETGRLAGGASLGTNLIDKLSPMVDRLRASIHTSMGVRQYAAYVVRRAWSGARVGMGALRVDSAQRIYPDPLVVLHDEHVLTEGGLQEQGTAILSEVSLGYSQDDLIGVNSASSETLYLLVDQQGSGIQRRAYVPADHPRQDRAEVKGSGVGKGKHAGGPVGWVIPLRRVDMPPLVVGVAL
jgi:hypothetical protein